MSTISVTVKQPGKPLRTIAIAPNTTLGTLLRCELGFQSLSGTTFMVNAQQANENTILPADAYVQIMQNNRGA